jgi:triosephosphate isomerase
MKKLIVGNWKMNLNVHEASLYLAKLAKLITAHRSVEAVLCPTFLALQTLSLQINHRQFKLGAQNCYWRDFGAFTGEVSVTQLRGLAQYVLVGHSERRYVFGETDRDVRFKTQAVLRNGLTPIVCVGETQFERAEGDTDHVISDQVVSGLLNVGTDEIDQVVVAYEPVWAIGNGEYADPRDVEKVVSLIRSQVNHLFGRDASRAVRILYGGSVDAGNAPIFLNVKGVDGLLVGSASLNAHEFKQIIDSAAKVAKEKS